MQKKETLTLAQEEKLVRAMQEGDKQAFQKMYRTLSPRIFERLIRLTGNPDVAEDCLQQVFIEVIDTLHRFRGEGRFESWVQQIATHLLLRRFRKQSRWKTCFHQLRELWPSAHCSEHPSIPDVLFSQEERKRWLYEALEHVGARKRIAILLCDIEGKSLEDAAQELNLPKGTVASRLHHGRKELRNQLEKTLEQQGLSIEEWIHV